VCCTIHIESLNYNTLIYHNFLPSRLGICTANVRQISANPEAKFGKLLVRLQDKVLYVAYDVSAITGTEPGWKDCFKVPVPIDDQLTGYYLGITAETGGLSDFHDVKSLTTWSIRPTPFKPTARETVQDQQEVTDKRRKVDEPKNKDKDDILKDKIRDSKDSNKLKKGDMEDPTIEIINRLVELEKKDDVFGTSLETKFKEMQQKLETMEKDQVDILNRLQQGLESIRSAVDVNRIEELKRDVKSALSALYAVQGRINTIETHVEGNSKKTADLHGLHDVRSTELLELVERNSAWGFWTYFMIFQVLFWGAIVWWKKSQDDKSKKFL